MVKKEKIFFTKIYAVRLKTLTKCDNGFDMGISILYELRFICFLLYSYNITFYLEI